VLTEIRATVRAYNVPLPLIDTGGAAQTTPVNGRIPVETRTELIQSQHDNLFTSGTLGRYSEILNSVLEHQRQ
jgi:NADH-quinone oxidoreductase subunit G